MKRPTRSLARSLAGRLALGACLLSVVACEDQTPAGDDEIRIGLLLSYSGYLAANSVNSERAVLMALETAAPGRAALGGRPLRLISRDTRSHPSKVVTSAREILNSGAAVTIGPDTIDLVTTLRPLLQDQTLILPSYATASDVEFKPPSWFVMGAATKRLACELVAQLKADGRQRPLLVVNPTGYNSFLSWVLTNSYGLPRHVLPTDQAPNTANVAPIAAAGADAYVLAAFPTSASPLVLALSALGALGEGRSWYLSPTLHTPAFLESIPKGVLAGARGVAVGTVAGAGDFRTAFHRRWQDQPLDDAYAFYDAAAVTILALTRAVAREGRVPTGTGLSPHVLAVTNPAGERTFWSELPAGMERLRGGGEVSYVGLSGRIEFDLSGQTTSAATRWWTIENDRFADLPTKSDCL